MSTRRVPLDLRKRAALSCDLCKTRRRKCVRDAGNHDCALCIENGVNCISTIPRRQRFHIPLQDLSSRHQVIEQIISRLFPKVAPHDVNHLRKLADLLEKNNIEICSIDDQLSVSANSVKIFSSTNFDDYHVSPDRIATPSREFLPTPTGHVDGSDRILQNSSGTLCYFGPSSSMAFVARLREKLLINDTRSLDSLQPKQRRLRKQFVADNYCSTMENSSAAVDQADLPNNSPVNPQLATRCNRSQRFVDSLPPRMEVDELIELFFVHVHPNMVLLYRPYFQTALEDIWLCHQQESENVGWIACCCVVLAFGCEHKILASTNKSAAQLQNMNSLQRKLIELALDMVPQLILSATLQSVQAFALLSLYLNATNQRNASWIMVGCAIRMAISLGMHRGDNVILGRDIRLTPVETELRKRVWWSLYIFEQYNSALFGRPSAIDEVETTADMPKESVLDEGFHRPPGLISHDISLARIVGRIRKSQAERSQGPCLAGQALLNSSADQQLLQELNTWYNDLPPVLKFSESTQHHVFPSHFRQLVGLQLRYQHAKLLLARPFHLNILQQTPTVGTEMITKFSGICVAAAFESWKLISKLWENGQFDRNLWLDGVFSYQCGMVLSLACLDTRITLSTDDRKELESTIEGLLKILHETSPNRPMSRLVQIADDFSSIVRAMRPPPASVGRYDQYRDQQVPQQSPHNSLADDDPGLQSEMSTDQPSVEFSSAYTADLDRLCSPSLQLQGHSSSMIDVPNSNFALPWGIESTELIDFMLDWDFPQAFGFDGTESCQAL